MMACSREVYVAAKHKHPSKQVSQKQACTQTCPQQKQSSQSAGSSLFGQAAASLNNIALKVFDVKGNLLHKQQIRMDDFLGSNYAADTLPEGSTFVMFHGNTAYYFLDNEN